MRGVASFIAGLVVGTLMMHPSAALCASQPWEGWAALDSAGFRIHLTDEMNMRVWNAA